MKPETTDHNDDSRIGHGPKAGLTPTEYQR
jgi:hypothetical protein